MAPVVLKVGTWSEVAHVRYIGGMPFRVCVYSGTPLMRTPLGPGSGVLIREVSLFQGLNFCACANISYV